MVVGDGQGPVPGVWAEGPVQGVWAEGPVQGVWAEGPVPGVWPEGPGSRQEAQGDCAVIGWAVD